MKKITVIFSVLLILGLVIGAYALSSQPVAKTDCCCKDSCPMKSKDKTAKSEKDSCCGGENCCKDGSCPMKSGGSAKAENKSGCCPCCGGDSCPLKAKGKSADKDKKEDSKEKSGQTQ